MAKRTTRKQMVLRERAEEFNRELPGSAPECTEGDEYVVEVLNSLERECSFIPYPFVPIEEGDPLLYWVGCCRCGCLRMPLGLEGAFCPHCGHGYQRGDPDFWKKEKEHLKHCLHFQEYAHRGSRTLPARCAAPAPSSSQEQVDALREALGRLDRVVGAIEYYNIVERWALKGKPVERMRQQALEALSEYVQKR